MSTELTLHPNDPVVWIRKTRGGPGYGERALARVTRINADGRVTITALRADAHTRVLHSVGIDELQRPAADERRKLEELELHLVDQAAGPPLRE